MILLDENFPDDQRRLLRKGGIHNRKIGREVSSFGSSDAQIIPLLHDIAKVTFITLDQDFFKRRLCHPAYCLVFLDVPADDSAEYARKFLNHPLFDTASRRLSHVARVHLLGFDYWCRDDPRLYKMKW